MLSWRCNDCQNRNKDQFLPFDFVNRVQTGNRLVCLLLPAVLAAETVGAQVVTDSTPAAKPLVTAATGVLTTIGSVADERLRLDQLVGGADTDGFLIRSASTLSPADSGGATVLGLFSGFGTVWNSALPFTQNDGSMWAGRGLSWQIAAGMRADLGRVSLILVPQVTYQQNSDFQTILYNRTHDGGRHALSSPWYDRPESIDMPSRFGRRSYLTGDLGQSSLTVALGPVSVGAATENLWWGPGVRNAIIMSNHAAGIPHLFLRSGRALATPLGDLEGRWMLGRLAESEYFDDTRVNDTRSFSALALTLRTSFEPDLTVGFARAVYAPAYDNSVSLAAAFDVFRDVGRPNDRPATDLNREPGADQVFSLFGRWIFPRSGLETYAEWARYEQPASLRDFLVLPHRSQGYTLGLQWARSIADGVAMRLQGELTYLEPDAAFDRRHVAGWYSSRPVTQGYTQRGQVIGASIGPGSSSQWLAVDLFSDEHVQAGAFAGRIRWDNHSFYASGFHPFFAHDVSLYAGIRAAYRLGGMDVSAEIATEGRMNYLYQSPSPDWGARDAVDLRNHSLRISVTPGAN
jgi:hypothetical protein